MELLEGSALLEDVELVRTRLKRAMCTNCGRPGKACWCAHLPHPRVRVGGHRVLVVQHPGEERRRLKTAPMLLQGLEPGACQIIVGRKCSGPAWEAARSRWKDRKWVVLYPSDEARAVEDLDPTEDYVVLMLDGTWPQARSMFSKSPALVAIAKVKVASSSPSEYVVRTQPTDACLSTVEAGARVLAAVLRRPEVYDDLVSPLRALVRCQLAHGAVEHDTVQERLMTGVAVRPTDADQPRRDGVIAGRDDGTSSLSLADVVPKRTMRKLKKCGFDARDVPIFPSSSS